MTQQQLARLTQLIAAGNVDAFYHWTAWERLRDSVLALDHYECQMCKARGRYSRAVVVHHVKHLRDRPDLALSIWDGHTRQLVSLCKACHELCHPERIQRWRYGPRKAQLTPERWD